jgi:ribosome recycling factor
MLSRGWLLTQGPLRRVSSYHCAVTVSDQPKFRFRAMLPLVSSDYILKYQQTPLVEFSRGMAKKGKGKSKGNKPSIDDIIDELSDDEEEIQDDNDDFNIDHKVTPLSEFLSKSKTVKKSSKGTLTTLKYSEFLRIVDGERFWREMQACVDQLKSFYVHHLSVRSSTSLDLLSVELEGDLYPLNEIATISKKDPKRLIIDASDFPQANQNIMKAIRESGLNLNPQQDGLKIFVPIPKVTKEYREKLAGGARKKLNETKEEMRSIQNNFQKMVAEREVKGGISSDNIKAAAELLKVG